MKRCGLCKAEFSGKERQRYCCARCRNTANAQASAVKRGDMQRGKGTRWYVKENGRHQHRVVAEHILGRPLRRGEIVHHKDGNKKNNSPENLEVMTQGQHMREHGLGIPGVAPAHKPWEARWKK